LISRNDVGFDAGYFACAADEFHRRMLRRRANFPHAMLATATHDHKRGEDVRARLAVLSECSADWVSAVTHWLELGRSFCRQLRGCQMPSDGDLAILFQTIVGAWPATLMITDRAGLKAYGKRVAAWQQKALREAKLHSDWGTPNEVYEQAAECFVDQLFGTYSNLLNEIADFARRLMPPGFANSLAQLLIKLTAPGVPDVYQGTEFWDLSLVDPDNRAPVDFAVREQALGHSAPNSLFVNWCDGRTKQFVLNKVLAGRRRQPDLFAKGDYVPLHCTGSLSGHVVAFARVLPAASAITVCPLHTSRLFRGAQARFAAPDWHDTRLTVPWDLSGSYLNQITGEKLNIRRETDIATMLSRLPAGLLIGKL
jgi:(1->4)-alpha-D-glucan 1-alpha-D-glucosylmutase